MEMTLLSEGEKVTIDFAQSCIQVLPTGKV